jgi:hypothetical protein
MIRGIITPMMKTMPTKAIATNISLDGVKKRRGAEAFNFLFGTCCYSTKPIMMRGPAINMMKTKMMKAIKKVNRRRKARRYSKAVMIAWVLKIG